MASVYVDDLNSELIEADIEYCQAEDIEIGIAIAASDVDNSSCALFLSGELWWETQVGQGANERSR